MTEIDEIELIKKHYGDFTGLYDPSQAVAHVKVLLDEIKQLHGARLLSVVFGHHKGAPRPFALYRRQDVTGVSGTGVVATGAVFEDGVTVVRWFGVHPSTVIWPSLEDAAHVHLHGGKTQIVWLSDELEPLAEMEEQRDRLAKALQDIAFRAGRLRNAHSAFGEIANAADSALAAESSSPVEATNG